MLSGCIPRGVDNSVSAGSYAPQTLSVPDREILATTPSWSPSIVEHNARLVNASIYTVKSGDNLYKIEAETGAGFRQIVSANDLVTPYVLRVGQQLQIPAGLYHLVSRGETGIAIARAYGASWSDIVSLNNLSEPYILREGQRLRLPDSASIISATSQMSPEQRATAFSLNIDDVVTGGEPALPRSGSQASLANQITKPDGFNGRFAWPMAGSVISRFGSLGGGRVNDGIKIAALQGTAVNASGGGVVVYSGNEIGVFGGLILVDHGGGWVTAYGHLGQLSVSRGDKVRAGQTIGTVGETGYVDQPQLHFEIRRDRKPVDPLTMLPTR